MKMTIKKKNAKVSRKEPGAFDVERYRKDFPILNEQMQDKPLVYLDNAATTQKPQVVIETLNRYYASENANIHRGIYALSEKATRHFEAVRVKVQKFLNAKESAEVIFVRGATEGINLVAQGYGRKFIQAGDEILITALEHHSNIVPWQMLAEEKGATLKVAPISDDGELLVDQFEKMLSKKTKIVSLTHVSNALGTINTVKRLINSAHKLGVPVLVDGAQSAPHMAVDVQDLDCDFFVFSGHKIYGPTGIGVIYGKRSFLEKMSPYQYGGDMISSVTFEKTTFNVIPHKFEAGTPHIAGVIGLGAAIDYVMEIGLKAIAAYEAELLRYATAELMKIPGLRIIGTAREKAAVISFVLEGVHPHDIGTILDQEGIAVRAGHHCAMPIMDRFKVEATARASFAFYNTKEEIDALVQGIKKVQEFFK